MAYRIDSEAPEEPAITDDDVAPFAVWTLDELEGSTELYSLRAAWTHEHDT